jgi:2-keto-3-deoxy-L-rhamnonate aldolase RhmA
MVADSIKRIVAAGRTAGCIAADADAARRYIDLGARYIASHAIQFMTKASRQFIQEVRK